MFHNSFYLASKTLKLHPNLCPYLLSYLSSRATLHAQSDLSEMQSHCASLLGTLFFLYHQDKYQHSL